MIHDKATETFSTEERQTGLPDPQRLASDITEKEKQPRIDHNGPTSDKPSVTSNAPILFDLRFFYPRE